MGNKNNNFNQKNNQNFKSNKIEITGLDLNHFGQCSFKINKNIYSVNNLLPGEKAIVEEITGGFDKQNQESKKYKLVKILTPSKKRQEVKCAAYNKCGSCHLLHLAYEDQIKLKLDYVNQCFKDNKLNIKVNEIVKAEKHEGYRNKMQVAYRYRDKNIVYGFYEEDSHRIINNDYCYVQSKEQNEIVKEIAKIMKDLHLTPYDEDKRTGVIRFALVRFARTTNEILVTIVTNGNMFPARNEFVKRLRAACPYITTITQNINSRKTSIVLGEEEQILYGNGYITDAISGINFKISSSTFFQINPYQVEKLYGKVKEYLELEGNEILIDAYCGVGTIGMTLAKYANMVYGVENNKQSVINAKNNAYENKIKNIRFECADATDYLVELAKEKIHVDALVMDPPRTGSTEKFLNAVNSLKPKKVVYVSCEASTLARDLCILTKEYNVKKVGIVDMFVGTYHVETVVCLSQKTQK